MFRDKAITLLMLLVNTSGATFEDEEMAIDILEENLKRAAEKPRSVG